MKIEMAESLILSWLKHAKECKVVQLNWKPSDSWNLYNEQEADNLLTIIEQHFPVFKNSKPDQLIKQAEIDVLGLNIDEKMNHYYAVDVAYHEQGLRYGKTSQECINIVLKKMLRSALLLNLYFNLKNGDIIFASPKINPAVYKELEKQINNVEKLIKELGFEYNFRLIANDNFTKLILNPIIELSSTVADTSELFMRALQLSNLCKKEGNKQIKYTSKNTNTNITYNEFKIGATVKNKIKYFLKNNKLTTQDISNLKDKNYCKKTFNLKYPLLINKNESRYDDKGRARYWVTLFEDDYYVCNDWYENQRQDFENWCSEIQNDK